MSFKKFLIWLIESLIVLLVTTLIFSSITVDFPSLMKGALGDIFAYSSPDVQKDVMGKLTEACTELEGKTTSNNIGSICEDYKSGNINDKQFFLKIVSSALPSDLELPQAGPLQKYNNFINYLNKNKLLYFVILVILAIILYLLIMDIKLFLLKLSDISFSIGILVMLPYFIVLWYVNFIGIDTTPILNSMLGIGSGFDTNAIISVILLLFLKTYNTFIITLGFLFLTIGIAGKIYKFVSKRKSKLETSKTKKKDEDIKELATKLKKSMKKDRKKR